MSVSQTAEYALRAVIQLARRPEAAQTTQQLADATMVPQSYLPKVLQPLTRTGMVSAQRGSNGGYRLNSDPRALSVLEVVNCVDPVRRLKQCPVLPNAPEGKFCSLHRLLDDELAETERRYKTTTIYQLLHPASDVPPLCVAPTTELQGGTNGHSSPETPSGSPISTTE